MKRILLYSIIILSVAGCASRANIDNSLKQYFDEYKTDGTFAMFNNANGRLTVYNLTLDTTRFLPAETFDIVTALAGLETGKISSDTMSIMISESKVDFMQAMKFNNAGYFSEISRRMGKDTLAVILDSLNYGNKNIGSVVDSFWNNNTLKVSNDEQLGFMKKLYFDQLPFRKSVLQQVKNAMVQEANTAYKLCYKTGAAKDEAQQIIARTSGWLEQGNHIYFFSCLTKNQNNSADPKADVENISKKILAHLGVPEKTAAK